jgi:hypothetical protein
MEKAQNKGPRQIHAIAARHIRDIRLIRGNDSL